LRTIRDNTLPSEKVVSMSLENSYEEFLKDDTNEGIFKKFLKLRISFLRQSNYVDEKMAA
jgi:hypothetical protein